MTDDLSTRIGAMEGRLHEGWEKISRAEEAGQNVSRWEEFWTTLLREYEQLCRELDTLPGGRTDRG